jgi:uncharacterized protein (DUF302 family)
MYGYKKETQLSYEDALVKATEELKKEGFGILTEIDVKATLKKKLEIEFPEYKILGACNPPLAHKALQAETDVGLLLPCNVIVYRKDNKTFINAILPTVAMNMIENPALAEIAKEVEEKMKKVVDKV